MNLFCIHNTNKFTDFYTCKRVRHLINKLAVVAVIDNGLLEIFSFFVSFFTLPNLIHLWHHYLCNLRANNQLQNSCYA